MLSHNFFAGMCWTGVGTDSPTTVDDVDSVACESAGNLWKECYGASILATGEWMFCDRYYPYTNVPGFLQGLPFIQTANSDKASDRADTDFLCFDIDIDSTVYVLYDNRAVVLPDWLSTTFTSQVQPPPLEDFKVSSGRVCTVLNLRLSAAAHRGRAR